LLPREIARRRSPWRRRARRRSVPAIDATREISALAHDAPQLRSPWRRRAPRLSAPATIATLATPAHAHDGLHRRSHWPRRARLQAFRLSALAIDGRQVMPGLGRDTNHRGSPRLWEPPCRSAPATYAGRAMPMLPRETDHIGNIGWRRAP